MALCVKIWSKIKNKELITGKKKETKKLSEKKYIKSKTKRNF